MFLVQSKTLCVRVCVCVCKERKREREGGGEREGERERLSLQEKYNASGCSKHLAVLLLPYLCCFFFLFPYPWHEGK